MRTKVYMLLLAGAIMIGAPSCSDYLDEDNKTGYTEELLYSTRSGIDGLIGACYSYSRAWYGKEAAYGLSEGGGDTFLTGNDNRQKILINYSAITADVSSDPEKMNCNLDEYWELFYSAINTCNTALKYIESHALLTDAEKAQYTGEVKCLRAFYYWHLVETWGPVQINREPIGTDNVSTDATRASELDVYTFMLEDLDDAEIKLAGKTAKDGRINLWAAKAFKARVLLYKANKTNNAQDYAKAASLADEVIKGSGASFYENYADCWKMANESGITNKEALFYINYSDVLAENNLPLRLKLDENAKAMTWTQMIRRKTDGTGGNVAHMMFVGTWNNCADVSSALTRTTNDAQNVIDGVDLEYFYSKYSRGFTRMVPSTYLLDLFNDETDQRYQASFRDVYEIAPKLRTTDAAYRTKNKWVYPNCQDTIIYLCKKDLTQAEAQAMADNARLKYRLMFRKAVSGVDIPALYDTDGRPTTGQPQLAGKGPEGGSLVGNGIKYTDKEYQGDRIFIALKKFETDDPTRTTNDKYTPEVTGRDFLVIRLSEMYLIKAEAEMHAGGNALGTLNELRKARAIAGKDNTISGAVTIDKILDERAIELCGEQQRWFDLKRTGKLLERVRLYNPDAKSYIKDFHILRPIPSPQIDATTNIGAIGEAGKFWQNSGY